MGQPPIPVKICRHCGEAVMKIHFVKYGDRWWHATPHGAAPTYRHCGDDHSLPVAEPLS